MYLSFKIWPYTFSFKTSLTVHVVSFKIYILVMRTFKIYLIKILVKARLVCFDDSNIGCIYGENLHIRKSFRLGTK